jgi:thiol-disulfide isomerase/thioredoxin
MTASAFCLVWYPAAFAQDPGQDSSPPASKAAPQTGSTKDKPQQPVADASDQPLSLAELARQARAKKQLDANPGSQFDTKAASKSVKLLDDDNMPRGYYAGDAPSSDNPAHPGSGTPASRSGADSPEAQYRGKVVLLDFWASWCGPCRSALPNLKRLQAVYGGDDFVVVSISEDDDESDWRAFVSSHQMTWPQRLDSNRALQKQFGVNGLPTYVLIGRDGSVLQKIVGEQIAESLPERIGPALRSALAAKP